MNTTNLVRSCFGFSITPLLFFLLSAAPAVAQSESEPAEQTARDDEKDWTLNGTLEGYYQYNFNEPYNRVNLLRAYDTRANSFSIQQLGLVFEIAPKVEESRRFGLRADLQFGQATATVQGSEANEPRPEVYRNVWQAYGSYVFPVGNGLRTDFGKFASMLGYETNYAKDNDHFSRAYLFNFLPFYHSGLRMTYSLNDRATLLYMLTNGIQQTEDFNDFKSSHVAAILKPAPPLTWTLNYYFGHEQPDSAAGEGPDGAFRVFDTNLAAAPGGPFTLGLDFSYTTSEVMASDPAGSLTGLGLYTRYQAAPKAALSVRYERVDDEGGLFGGVPQLLQEVTFTAEYRFDEGFLLRGELRRDWSDVPFFVGSDPSSPQEGQTTVLVGMVWWIGGKKGAW
jgi:hypothetical protein